MKLPAKAISCFLFIFFLVISCRRAYDPPAIQGNNHFLAVNGFIYTGTSASSIITLSRSLNLNDSLPDRPELNALVIIESSGGDSFTLIDSAGIGEYVSSPLNLDTLHQYRLVVST
jgi:hypothetical protein